MEEEIDIRPYILSLLKNWYWIVGAGFVTALLAFGLSSLLDPTYQATALVAIAEPRQRVQFDERIETITENQPLRAYPELALSDEVLTNLLSERALDEGTSLYNLRQLLEAEPSNDPSLLRLIVQHEDPEKASALANMWAELFVEWANRVYGFRGGDQLRSFQAQLQQAEQDLTAAEDELIAFQAQNRTVIVANELEALRRTQADYLRTKQEIVFLMQDVSALRSQLEQQSSNASTTVADQITALFLGLKAFNVETNVPMQFQFDTLESLTQQSRLEQIQLLDSLVETLATRLAEIELQVVELEPQILTLQEEQQNLAIEDSRVNRNYVIVKDTYVALARQVEEERITSQDTSSGVRLASKSAVPENPVAPRVLINTIVAGGMGGMFAVFVILALGWWRTQQ